MTFVIFILAFMSAKINWYNDKVCSWWMLLWKMFGQITAERSSLSGAEPMRADHAEQHPGKQQLTRAKNSAEDFVLVNISAPHLKTFCQGHFFYFLTCFYLLTSNCEADSHYATRDVSLLWSDKTSLCWFWWFPLQIFVYHFSLNLIVPAVHLFPTTLTEYFLPWVTRFTELLALCVAQRACICMTVCFHTPYACVCVWMDQAESVNTSLNANQSLPEQPHPSLFFSLLPAFSRSLKVDPQHINWSQHFCEIGKIYSTHTQRHTHLCLKPRGWCCGKVCFWPLISGNKGNSAHRFGLSLSLYSL